MQTKLETERIRQAVNIANRFIPLKPTLPVLANIKLESQKTKLRLTSTNLENSIIVEVPAVGEVWETTVPAKLMVEFLNLSKSKETKLAIEKETLVVETQEAKGVLNTIDANEFPKVQKEEKKGVEVGQKELIEAVSKIVFAASSDTGKPVLNGILVRVKSGKTAFVATDSYRLAQFQLPEEFNLGDTIIPARSFYEAVKIAGELGEEVVSFGTLNDNNQAFISGDSFQISIRLIDGVYPSFENIIPTEFVSKVKVSKEEASAAVKQTAVFARDTGNVIKFFLNKKGEIKVWASTKQVGEGTTKIKAEVEGEDLEVAFNSNFFLEGLDAITSKEVTINFAGALKPAIISGENKENFIYVVMPVKPQN